MIPLRKDCLYFIMEANTIIVLKEMYLASWSKCLFRINSQVFPYFYQQHILSCKSIWKIPHSFFLFDYYIPNIILVFFHHNIFHEFVLSGHQHIIVFCIQPLRLEPTLLLVKSRSIRKLSTMSNSDIFCSHSP